MNERSWLRLGAAFGIFSVVLEIVGLVVGVVSAPAFIDVTLASSEKEIARAFASPATTGVWIGLYLEVIAFLLFVVFAARLWATLRRAEGGIGWASHIVLGAGMLFAGTSLLALAFGGMAHYQAGPGVDVHVATVLKELNFGTYALSWAPQALFLAATAVVVLRTRALSRWLGWSAAVISAAALAGMAVPMGELSQIPPFLFLIWVVAASIVLIRHTDETSLASASVPASEARAAVRG